MCRNCRNSLSQFAYTGSISHSIHSAREPTKREFWVRPRRCVEWALHCGDSAGDRWAREEFLVGCVVLFFPWISLNSKCQQTWKHLRAILSFLWVPTRFVFHLLNDRVFDNERMKECVSRLLGSNFEVRGILPKLKLRDVSAIALSFVSFVFFCFEFPSSFCSFKHYASGVSLSRLYGFEEGLRSSLLTIWIIFF